jgi:hypothetical protein
VRKTVIDPATVRPDSRTEQVWLDLEEMAKVEVTSEDPDFPVESALVSGKGPGWRAAGEVSRPSASCSTRPSRTASPILPREAPWLVEYLHELTTFPNAKYSDQADSTSQALAWINGRGASSAAAWIDYQRGEVAYQRHLEGLSVQAIAAIVRATPEEVQRWIDQHAPSPGTFGARTNSRALPQREPGMTELEVDSPVREYMSGRPIACSHEEYERRIRPALQDYAALCLKHNDQVYANFVLRAFEDLDRRFNFAG